MGLLEHIACNCISPFASLSHVSLMVADKTLWTESKGSRFLKMYRKLKPQIMVIWLLSCTLHPCTIEDVPAGPQYHDSIYFISLVPRYVSICLYLFV